MKLVSIETTRGRRVLMRAEDIEIKISVDGLIRAYCDFGPIVERVLPVYEATAIAAGEIPEYLEDSEGGI